MLLRELVEGDILMEVEALIAHLVALEYKMLVKIELGRIKHIMFRFLRVLVLFKKLCLLVVGMLLGLKISSQ